MFPSICNCYSDILNCTIYELSPLLTWQNNVKSAIWLNSDYSKVQGVYLQSAEGKGGVPIIWHLFVTITRQLILTLVSIVCFVAIQTRTMAKRMGINWSLFEYSTSSWCLRCLGGMRLKGFQMVQLYPCKNSIYSRLPRQGLCLPYLQQQKIEHQFMPDVEKKSLKGGLSPGTQRVGVW